jgi:transposase-like protein
MAGADAVPGGRSVSVEFIQVSGASSVREITLGNWVAAWRDEHADEESEPPSTLSERARLRELEREVRELRMETISWQSELGG